MVPEHPVDPDGDAQVPTELFGQAQVGDLEAAFARRAGQGQGAVDGRAVGDRHAEQRGRAEQHQQRRLILGKAENPRVVGVRHQDGRARVVNLGWHGAGLRIEDAHLPGQVLRRLVVRADNVLSPEPLRPLDVDNHPARDAAGQQPCAALQRDRLAERAVVEQQPGDLGDHVHPARHGPDCVASGGTTPPRPPPLLFLGGPIPPDPPWEGLPALPFPPGSGGGDHEEPRAVLRRDDAGGQDGVDRSIRPEQPALHLPGRPRSRRRGELARDRGAERQVDECGQRLAGRVSGRRADQVPGPGVRAPHGGILLEHEQGHRRVLEHGP